MAGGEEGDIDSTDVTTLPVPSDVIETKLVSCK